MKDCSNRYFPSFECRCVFDIRFINMESIEEVNLTTTLGYRKFQSQFYGLNNKIRNAQKNGFNFSKLVKLTEN